MELFCLSAEGSSGVATGAARPGCHHFGVTPFYDASRAKLEMFSTVEWTEK